MEVWKGISYSQFQQCQIGIAVICPVLALLCDIVLEDRCSLRIVSVKTIQYTLNMLWPIWRVVECDTHNGERQFVELTEHCRSQEASCVSARAESKPRADVFLFRWRVRALA